MEKTISLTNKLNNNGKRGFPCGTQDITEIESEIKLLYFTNLVTKLVKNEFSYDKKGSEFFTLS